MRLLSIIVLLSVNYVAAQVTTSNVLWDKKANKPIVYATVKSAENHTISNEDGVFELEKTLNTIKIQSVVYEALEVDFNFLKTNDTVYMKPLTYELEEVVVNKDGVYTQMLKTILREYALEPHQEKFFLRAVVRRNNKLYKIVDFTGFIEKKTLFNTKTKPMPKKNYTIQINNLRKVGVESREIDFAFFSFKNFFSNINIIMFNKSDYNISYEKSVGKNDFKINLLPKNIEKNKLKATYLLNKDKTFKEVVVAYSNKNGAFENIKKSKYRTVKANWKTSFERNKSLNKLQLSKAVLHASLEIYDPENKKDVFAVTYIYYSNPVTVPINIKNNTNLNKDMFDLKGSYKEEYWKSQEVLTLTQEMQSFINKVNSLGKNSDFKTKTNIK